jgi:DNA-binding NarL/FixJ family response regulator
MISAPKPLAELAGETLARREVLAIEKYMSQRATVALLSPRQLEVAREVARGSQNKHIAFNLGMKEQTVKNHMHVIFSKLGLSDRLSLALWVIASDLRGGGV